MSAITDKTPRQLAREYAEGLLNFDDYRQMRRQVVDELTGYHAEGEDDPQDDDTLPHGRQVSGTGGAPGPTAGRKRLRPLVLLLAIGLPLAAVALWWLIPWFYRT